MPVRPVRTGIRLLSRLGNASCDDLRERGVSAEFYSRNIADIELSSLYRFHRKP
ncbi:hypothetical protein X971_4100 [Agrobacterium tumefaciens LBA4213 (Ach5)]|jgi:hypothetical protein|nr:hypothetical protein AGROH133_13025 [Agrobacterium tumefaciens]AHK03949.1 hypothetical protein X971_4100 [Agrobacterium tumefaciens LBA4213 (Ach5)]